MSFDHNIDEASEANLKNILQTTFGYADFRRGQLDIIRAVLRGEDTLAVMPTGGGKSLCYQIPALYRKGIVVVISPLIALMKDQVQNLKCLGIPAGALHSGQELEEKQVIFSSLARSERFVLYVSPERVQKPGFATWIKDKPIALFAIDEAHCVSQWGPEFRQDYHKLSLLRQIKPEVPILALTATATPTVLGDVSKQLGLNTPSRHVYGFYRSNLYCQVENCDSEGRKSVDDFKLKVLAQAITQNPTGRIIIYCGTRKQCEEVTSSLSRDFDQVAYYHAGLGSKERTETQNQFHSGAIRILAATNAFGMGIDHADIRLVVHYQMPANVESFYQEMGRAGRDGSDSTCLLLYSKKDRQLHSFFIRQSESDSFHISSRWKALDMMTQFAEGGECRHAGILTYFRDTQRITHCGHCDVCIPDSPRKILIPKESQEAYFKTAVLNPCVKKKKSAPRQTLAPSNDKTVELRAEVLKTWRKSFAESLDLPAFVIFSNKTLRDLAERAPHSLSELEDVYGMGPKKIENFGKQILEQIKNCDSSSL